MTQIHPKQEISLAKAEVRFSAIAVFGLAGFVCPLATPERSDDALADRLGKAPHNHGDAGGEQTFRGLHLLGEAGLGDGDERNRRF